MDQQCTIAVEDVWGPRVQGCGANFDLTLLFQEVVGSICPLAITCIYAACRAIRLCRRKSVMGSWYLYRFKVCMYILSISLQIALLCAQLTLRTSLTKASATSTALGIVGFAFLLACSLVEHSRSPRPSTIIICYLGVSVPLDALRSRTLWSMPRNVVVAALLTALTVCKFTLLFLEACPKKAETGTRDYPADETAGIISRAFVWWLMPLFSKGYRTPLTSQSLPDIASDLDGSAAEHDENEHSTKSHFFSHLLRTRGSSIGSAVLPRLFLSGFTYAQPFLVQAASTYIMAPDRPDMYKVGGGLIAAYFIVYVGMGTSRSIYRHCTARSITAVRGDLVKGIYTHSSKLNSSSKSRSSAVTLMSADVERISYGSRQMHECWACLIDIAIGLWLLESRLGLAVAASGGLSAILVLVTLLVLLPAGKRQSAWLKSNEVRIAATVDTLKNIKGIKMTGASQAVVSELSSRRNTEQLRLRRLREMMLVVGCSAWIPTILAPVAGFTVYALHVAPRRYLVLDETTIFASLTIFTILNNAIATLIESSLQVVGALASLLRIRDYLGADNKRYDRREGEHGSLIASTVDRSTSQSSQTHDEPEKLNVGGANVSVRLTNAGAGWQERDALVFAHVNLEVDAPSVTAIVGRLGCGKSTLLKLLLGETQVHTGEVHVSCSRIGYCSQTPWLTNASIRDNIVGPEHFDAGWYSTVMKATLLDHDCHAMAVGDATKVGNEGRSLSGGQKKRVALARAVYSKAQLLVLDDPFNGLDTRTEEAVLEALLGHDGLFRQMQTTIIWATSSSEPELPLLSHPRFVLTGIEHQVRFSDEVAVLAEQKIRLQSSSVFMDGMHGGTDHESETQESRDPKQVHEHHTASIDRSLPGAESAPSSDTATYKYFIKRAGYAKMAFFLILSATFAFGMSFSQIWVSWWARNNATQPQARRAYYIGVYFALGCVQLLGWIAACFFFISVIAEKLSMAFHRELLDTCMKATMAFFDVTDSGSIINRFSQDLQLIDTEFPLALVGTANALLITIGQCVVIVYGSPWSGLAMPAIGIVVYILQRGYLRTSRRLRVIEIESKAPLFSNFLATLNGLDTIRALQWSSEFTRRNSEAVHSSQRPFFLLFVGQIWLEIVLDLITAGLAVVLMSVGVAARASGNMTIGLSLLGTIGFSAASKQLIITWTQLEIALGAISRVKSFTDDTPQERIAMSNTPKIRGAEQRKRAISFVDVCARYSSHLPLALRNVSFEIQPGERYAICGRTGSGKSTLLSSLLRLIEPSQGRILVGGIDIASLEADVLRSSFITLPQEPVLITGSVRQNANLYRNSTDEAIIQALRDFHLWDTIESKGGLDVPLTAEMLSHGQMQLFCFARSTLQQSDIVILDEPSSQFDRETEQQMQLAIRERFAGLTVLCIAHKLATILNFDQVLVMEAGAVVEHGNPRALLGEPESRFSILMRHS